MAQKLARNKGPRGVAVRKIKQLWRRKQTKPSPPWADLPLDITANILHRLGSIDLLDSAQFVCTTWRSICNDSTMWQVIDMREPGDVTDCDLDHMCRHAVDKSQGQLVEINLEYFASDQLLDYISTRSEKLKRLHLACCRHLSDEGLIKAVKKFPKLEELHIILTPICYTTVEMIGQSCPLLSYFAYNKKGFRMRLHMPDEDALAIARSMPGLRHLQLLGNGLTDVGLKAIIDGCPHLESLDLRSCYHVKDVGDIVNGCSTEIKCLKYPDESTSDYEFEVDDELDKYFTSDYGYSDEDSDDYYIDPNNEFENYRWDD